MLKQHLDIFRSRKDVPFVYERLGPECVWGFIIVGLKSAATLVVRGDGFQKVGSQCSLS